MGAFLAVRYAGNSPKRVTLGGMTFEQLPFQLGTVDFQPSIPAWVATEAAGDFARAYHVVGSDLGGVYPAGPFNLDLYASESAYVQGMNHVEHAASCSAFLRQSRTTVPMGDHVLGIPVSGQGALAFSIGHEYTDALLGRIQHGHFGNVCSVSRLLAVPWVSDGFADYVGAQVSAADYGFYPMLHKVDQSRALTLMATNGRLVPQMALVGWNQWSSSLRVRSGAAPVQYAVADAMVQRIIQQGGFALLRRVVTAAASGSGMSSVLGQSQSAFAHQAWSTYRKWFLSQHPPVAYLAARVWRWRADKVQWTGRVYGYGWPSRRRLGVLVNGRRPTGAATVTTPAGSFLMSVPVYTSSVVVNGVRAILVSGPPNRFDPWIIAVLIALTGVVVLWHRTFSTDPRVKPHPFIMRRFEPRWDDWDTLTWEVKMAMRHRRVVVNWVFISVVVGLWVALFALAILSTAPL